MEVVVAGARRGRAHGDRAPVERGRSALRPRFSATRRLPRSPSVVGGDGDRGRHARRRRDRCRCCRAVRRGLRPGRRSGRRRVGAAVAPLRRGRWAVGARLAVRRARRACRGCRPSASSAASRRRARWISRWWSSIRSWSASCWRMPISTSWPREISTSRPRASAASTSGAASRTVLSSTFACSAAAPPRFSMMHGAADIAPIREPFLSPCCHRHRRQLRLVVAQDVAEDSDRLR